MNSGVLNDLIDEQSTLDALVANLTDRQWSAPSAAVGWRVIDQIAHLSFFDDVACDSLSGDGEARFADIASQLRSGAGRYIIERPAGDRTGPAVLADWRRNRAAMLKAFRSIDPSTKVPWGPNQMSAVSLCTARLMETWAHGLDCFAGLGVDSTDTDRLRHVCHLVHRSIPNAMRQAGVTAPGSLDDLVVELVSPAGDPWIFGPESASNRIVGSASEFARVGVRRMPLNETNTLTADGPLAQSAIHNLKAYL
ncbi:hypothetical protein AU194_20905 [Mycobacterium sp. GA-2829]|nr:hypothetical protein AU194_20905 [Mycobacterium sp. GA-2829]